MYGGMYGMGMYGMYGTFRFLLPAILLTLFAQWWVKSTYKQYSKVNNRKRYTGADVARELLERSGIYDVSVELIGGNLTDHYDPRSKVLRLSQGVYQSTSVAALGIAAHETGHAIQDNEDYAFLRLRSAIVPITNIGSNLSMPMIVIGMLISGSAGSSLGYGLMQMGVILFSLAVVFTLVTLPVEFNASSRAVALLSDYGFLEDDELYGAKKVLKAAALTYVAAAATAIANLLRMLSMLAFYRNRE